MSANVPVDPLSRSAVPSALPQVLPSSNLDFLRAFAVACVVISHLLDALGYGGHGSLGRFGVVLFFVHTSLVLMASLDRMQQLSSGWRLIAGFWLRRIFRIYPLSIVTVVAVWAIHLPPNTGALYTPIHPFTLISNLLLIQNLTYEPNVLYSLWTLPLEVQMYVLLPFLFLCIADRRYPSFLLWVVSILFAEVSPQISERLSVFLYAPCFIAGVVAFDLLRRSRRLLLPAWVWPLGILIATALFGPWDNISLPHKIGRAWVLALTVGVLYPHVQEMRLRAAQRAVHWIAEHSYGIYLCHGTLLWLAFEQVPRWAAWPFLAATLLGLPALLYRFVERPLMLVGAHLSRRVLHARMPWVAVAAVE